MDEFRSQPKPGDWAIPPEFEEAWKSGDGIDPVNLSILKEHEWDGVPIPFGFQSVKELTDNLERLETGESPTVIASEMIADFAEKQERYPDTGMWDRGRSMAVARFAEFGHYEEARQLLAAISDARVLMGTVMQLEEIIPAETASEWTGSILQDSEPERAIAIARAARDNLIENEPSSDLIDTFNTIIAGFSDEPDFDWVNDWIKSQREIRPNIDWSTAETLLKNDEVYGSMPMATRLFAHLIFVDTLKEIADDELDEGFVESTIRYYDNARDGIYADATIWEHEMGNIAKALIKKGGSEAAVEIAGAIREPGLMARMVLEFVESDHEEEAIELATHNPDPKMSAELLLDVEYKDRDAATQKLAEVIQGDEYPVDKRIGVLEVIRDRMREMGQPDNAANYQRMIDEIQEEQ